MFFLLVVPFDTIETNKILLLLNVPNAISLYLKLLVFALGDNAMEAVRKFFAQKLNLVTSLDEEDGSTKKVCLFNQSDFYI